MDLDTVTAAVRNHNESRVRAALAKHIEDLDHGAMDTLDVADIYALALNLLPPWYRPRGSVALTGGPTAAEIEAAVAKACKQVTSNPHR